jgi:serine/threonine protein kinase
MKEEDREYWYSVEGKSATAPVATIYSQRLAKKPTRDLFNILVDQHHFPESIALRIFREMVEAVQYLHEKDIFHRDIKDTNFLIDSEYNVKLIDFGSALYRSSSDTGCFPDFVATSQDFASPEIISRMKHSGKAADVWALGILLFLMLNGDVPFHSIFEIRKNVLAKTTSSAQCQTLMEWMLNKDPNRRPTCDQILSYLSTNW